MSLSKMDLTGKVALVTGGSRGLGRGMALALAEAGADVAIASRTLSALEKTAEQIRQGGSRSLPLPIDVSRVDQINKMIKDTLDEFGRIDILVNNAGTVIRKPSLEITEADWDKVVNTILKASFFCAQAAAKAMIKQKKGKIINIGSLTSVRGLPRIIPYVASRGGILQLTKGLAVEWAPYNINVNAIGPGYFKTQQTAPLFADKEWVKKTVARIPLGRTGIPQDLAGVVVFLASEASDYITGQMIFVDGGWLAAL
ncbi:MAG: glucose 1-dehydrogenase [Clostridia bacterium]|jgi:NAD(P)-dependent dehydrogenase (short-subunit alcohol dehydrogenase family)|nr:glucose 1-dehydrogenase [Clostridia bacterium]